MCEFCELKNDDVSNVLLGGKDGLHSIEVRFERFNEGSTNSIVLDETIDTYEYENATIFNDSVKIDFCPFCGEKLTKEGGM